MPAKECAQLVGKQGRVAAKRKEEQQGRATHDAKGRRRG